MVERPVARGRSGVVYRAVAPDGTPVALKVHDRDDDGRQEIARLAALDHPGVAGLVDHGVTDDGVVWLALRWVEGRTLAHLLAMEAPLPVDRVRRLIDELAAAIDAIHDAGIVHGDLAPSNVIVGDDDRVTLVDLGAARTLAAATSIDETTGLVIETTPRYAAPEIATGGSSSAESDVYALGLIAYEALTASFPYPDVETPIAMLGHHASSEPVPPSEHRPDLPMGAEEAVLDALAKEPIDRPARPSAFATALRRDAPARRRSRSARSGSLRGALVALAVVALIGSVALVQLRRGDAPVTASRSSSETLPDVSVSGADTIPAVTAAASVPDGSSGVSELADADGWPAGRSASAVCNLVAIPGFELTELPDTYYSGDPTNTTAIVPGAGVDATAALRVGSNGAFGIFGEIVPLGDEREFVFSAWVRQQGTPGVTAIYVDYLDADYVEITAERDTAVSAGTGVGDADGLRLSLRSAAPADAAFAVPTFFKDGTGGSLLVDEVIFGPASSCPEWAS